MVNDLLDTTCPATGRPCPRGCYAVWLCEVESNMRFEWMTELYGGDVFHQLKERLKAMECISIPEVGIFLRG